MKELEKSIQYALNQTQHILNETVGYYEDKTCKHLTVSNYEPVQGLKNRLQKISGKADVSIYVPGMVEQLGNSTLVTGMSRKNGSLNIYNGKKGVLVTAQVDRSSLRPEIDTKFSIPYDLQP